jgi:hypothetical protein
MASQGRYHRNIFKESKRYQSALMQKSDIGHPSYIIDADFRDWSDIILRQHQRGMSDIWLRLDGEGAAQDNLPALQHSWALIPATVDDATRPSISTDKNFIISGQQNRLLTADRNSPENCAAAYVGGLRATLFGDADFRCTILNGLFNSDIADGIHRKYTSIAAGVLRDDRASWTPGFFARQATDCYVRLPHGTYQITGNTSTSLLLAGFTPGQDSTDAAFTDPIPSGDRYYYIQLKANPAGAAADLQVKVYVDVHVEDFGRQEDPELNHNPGGSPIEGMRRNKLIQQVWISYDGTNMGVPETSQPITDYTDYGGVRHHVKFMGNMRIQPGANAPAAEGDAHDNNIINGDVAAGDDIDDGRDRGGIAGGSPNLYTVSCFSQVGVNGRAPSVVGDLDARLQNSDGAVLDTLITEWSQQPTTLSERLERDATVATVGSVQASLGGGVQAGQYYGAQGIQAALDCPSVKAVYVKSGNYYLDNIKWTTDSNTYVKGDPKESLTVPMGKRLIMEQYTILSSTPTTSTASVILKGENVVEGGIIIRVEAEGVVAGAVLRVEGGAALSNVKIANSVAVNAHAAVYVAGNSNARTLISNCRIASTGNGVYVNATTNNLNSVTITSSHISSSSEDLRAVVSVAANAMSVTNCILSGKRRLMAISESPPTVRSTVMRTKHSSYNITNNYMYVSEGTGTESCVTLQACDINFSNNFISFKDKLAAATVDSTAGILPLNTIYVVPSTTDANVRCSIVDNTIDAGINGIHVSATSPFSYVDITNNDIKQMRRDSYPAAMDGCLIRYHSALGNSFFGKINIRGNSCSISGAPRVAGTTTGKLWGIIGVGSATISGNVISASYGTDGSVSASELSDSVEGIYIGLPDRAHPEVSVTGNLVVGGFTSAITVGGIDPADSGRVGYRPTGASVTGNSVFGARSGIISKSPDATISGNNLRQIFESGITCSGPNGARFEGIVSNNRMQEICTSSTMGTLSATTSIPGTMAWGSILYGIAATGGLIEGNVIENCSGTGVRVQTNSENVSVIANHIDNCGEGIAAPGPAKNLTVSSNTISGTRSHAISIGEDQICTNVQVCNNSISGASSSGGGAASYGQALFMGKSKGVLVSSNNIDWTYRPPASIAGVDDTKGITTPVLTELNGHGIAFMGVVDLTMSGNRLVIDSDNYAATTNAACVSVGSYSTRKSSNVTISDNSITARSENTALWVIANSATISSNIITNTAGQTQVGRARRALYVTGPGAAKKTVTISGNIIDGSGLAVHMYSNETNAVSVTGNTLNKRGIWAYGNSIAITSNKISSEFRGNSDSKDPGQAILSSAIYVGDASASMITNDGSSRRSAMLTARNECWGVDISSNTIIGHSEVGQKINQGVSEAYEVADAPQGRGACIVAMVGKNSRVSNNTLQGATTGFTGAIGILIGNINYRSKAIAPQTSEPFGRVGATHGLSVDGNRLMNGMKLIAVAHPSARVGITNNVFTLGTHTAGSMVDAYGSSSQALVQLYNTNFDVALNAGGVNSDQGIDSAAVINFVGNTVIQDSEGSWWPGSNQSNDSVAYIMTSSGRNYPENKDGTATAGDWDLQGANIALLPACHNISRAMGWGSPYYTPSGASYQNTAKGMHGEAFWLSAKGHSKSIGTTETSSEYRMDSLEVVNPGFRYYGPRATGVTTSIYVMDSDTARSQLVDYVHDHKFIINEHTIDNGPKQPNSATVTYKLDHHTDFRDGATGWGPEPV